MQKDIPMYAISSDCVSNPSPPTYQNELIDNKATPMNFPAHHLSTPYTSQNVYQHQDFPPAPQLIDQVVDDPHNCLATTCLSSCIGIFTFGLGGLLLNLCFKGNFSRAGTYIGCFIMMLIYSISILRRSFEPSLYEEMRNWMIVFGVLFLCCALSMIYIGFRTYQEATKNRKQNNTFIA